MLLVLCGLGAFFVTQLVKVVWFLPRPPRPLVKMVVALGTSLGVAAALFPHHTRDFVIYGVAGAGLAVLTHKVARYFSVQADFRISQIMADRLVARKR